MRGIEEIMGVISTTDKYRLIGEYTNDPKARRILGQRCVDGMTLEAIVRNSHGDAFLDDHSERVRKRKLEAERKKMIPLFEDFEKFLAWEKERLEKEDAEGEN